MCCVLSLRYVSLFLFFIPLKIVYRWMDRVTSYENEQCQHPTQMNMRMGARDATHLELQVCFFFVILFTNYVYRYYDYCHRQYQHPGVQKGSKRRFIPLFGPQVSIFFKYFFWYVFAATITSTSSKQPRPCPNVYLGASLADSESRPNPSTYILLAQYYQQSSISM